MSQELKPYPFCGYVHKDGRSHVEVTIPGRAKCFRCSASVYGKNEQDALAAWNDGATNYAALLASHKELMEALKMMVAQGGPLGHYGEAAFDKSRSALANAQKFH